MGEYDYLKNMTRVRKKWYGNDYGGFFVCPELLNERSVIYSFGIGEDISFDEEAIQKHNCSVFGFDPTPKSIAWIKNRSANLPINFRFFEYGISDRTAVVDFYLPKNKEHVSGSFVTQTNIDENQVIKAQMKSLSDIARELGHEQIDALKMDIEGAEYIVLESVLNSGLRINQLLIEFHQRFFPDGHARTANMVELLRKNGFTMFGVSDGFDEISFIHERVKPAN